MKENRIGITVGDVNITMLSQGDCPPLTCSGPHVRFLDLRSEPDLLLKVRCCEADPTVASAGMVFNSGGPWKLYKAKERYILSLSTPPDNPRPYLVAVLRTDFRSGDVFVQPSQRRTVHAFPYPLDELLMVQLLSRGRGVILHACGVVDEGKGILFCGVSGAGKSTVANIWKPTYATLLSDDRIIVRRMDGVFRMYGTPWHGDANVCDPGNAPLEKVFFIVHADRNYAKPISPIDAASKLLVRCFPPLWDKDGMEFVTNFLAEVAEEVPCYELGFVPDQSVVEFVRSIE